MNSSREACIHRESGKQALIEKITYVIIGLDHHQINVAAGAHVVEDTSCNGVPITKN